MKSSGIRPVTAVRRNYSFFCCVLWRWSVLISAAENLGPGAHPASYNGYWGLFSGGKTAGAWRCPPTPSGGEVKERVELYLSSPSGSSWPVLGWTIPLPIRGNLCDGQFLSLYTPSNRRLLTVRDTVIICKTRWSRNVMFCVLLRPVLPEFHQYVAVYIPFALSKIINLQNPQALITLPYGTSLTLLHSVAVSKSAYQYSCEAHYFCRPSSSL